MAASRKKHSDESRVPGWVWLFTGAVLGAFIMFLFRLSELPTPGSSNQTTTTNAKQEKSKPKLPQFDFYDLLRETKVPVPESSSPEKSLPAITQNMEYILQVASFRGKEDAEQVRAELILLNLDARVESATVRSGETWYRVLVGPFESRSLLAKARSTLVANKHEALVLKRPKEG